MEKKKKKKKKPELLTVQEVWAEACVSSSYGS